MWRNRCYCHVKSLAAPSPPSTIPTVDHHLRAANHQGPSHTGRRRQSHQSSSPSLSSKIHREICDRIKKLPPSPFEVRWPTNLLRSTRLSSFLRFLLYVGLRLFFNLTCEKWIVVLSWKRKRERWIRSMRSFFALFWYVALGHWMEVLGTWGAALWNTCWKHINSYF